MDDELADIRAELADLHDLIKGITGILAGLQQDALTETAWWWPAMTQPEARGNWSKLIEWVDEIDRWYGTPTSTGTRSPAWLVACWYRHPRALDAMTSLYVIQREAYAKRSTGWNKGEWLTRWHRDLTSVIKEEAGSCSGGRCEYDGTAEPGSVQVRAAFGDRLVTQLPDGSRRPERRVSGGDGASPPLSVDLD